MAENAQQQYDVVIIGSGPGGYVAGIRAGQLGMKVAVVEKDPFLGGTCLHRGCIPTKSLLENADVWGKIQKAKDFGITVGDVTINFSEVQKRKQGVVDNNAKGIEFLFKKNKVERILGHGRVVKAGVVEVEGEGGKKTLNTKNIILAMGSVPRDLPHIKADGKRIINSDHILMLDYIPKSMLVIGAGAVGCEFASIFSRFGTKTTIVEVMPQLLPIEDDEIAKEFTRIFKKKGIDVFTDAKVLSCEVGENGVKSTVEVKGKQQVIETELVLSATGRGPVTGDAGLKNTKVKVSDRGFVEVDEFMRTARAGHLRHRRHRPHSRPRPLRLGRRNPRCRAHEGHARARHQLRPRSQRDVHRARGCFGGADGEEGEGEGLRREDRQVPLQRELEGEDHRRVERSREDTSSTRNTTKSSASTSSARKPRS